MTLIIAQGEKNKVQVTITVEGEDKGNYSAIEIEPPADFIKEEFDRELKAGYAMGNYIPEEKTLLNVYNVLNNYFFDKPPNVIVKGDIGTIPYDEKLVEEGCIY